MIGSWNYIALEVAIVAALVAFGAGLLLGIVIVKER